MGVMCLETAFPFYAGSDVSVTSVEAGGYHNCAVMADHKVMVWGRGDVG